jgi:hypothetical protein
MTCFLYRWEGDAFTPLVRFKKRCDEAFTVGEIYPLDIAEERSMRSHRHYFASVREAWVNLPDDISMDFASSDMLRKHALIMTGYFKERRFIASSADEARKIARFISIRDKDDYAIVSVAGNVVVERRAKSQSIPSMGSKLFQQSKRDVLAFLSEMVGVSAESLEQNAEQAA